MNNSRKFSVKFSAIVSKGFDNPDDVLLYLDPNYDEMTRSKSPSKSPPRSPPKSPIKNTRNLSDSVDDLIKYTKDDWIEIKPDPSNKGRDKDEGKKFTIEEQAMKLSFSTSSLKNAWTKSNELIKSRTKQAFTLKRKTANDFKDNDQECDESI